MRGGVFSPHTPGIWVTEIPNRYMCTETIGSPEFPRYPLECMHWSQTPVVTWLLTLTLSGLLPSGFQRPSAFTSNTPEAILLDHGNRFIGAQYRAYILVPSGFGLPLPGLPSDFTTDLLVKLWSGGTCTYCWYSPTG